MKMKRCFAVVLMLSMLLSLFTVGISAAPVKNEYKLEGASVSIDGTVDQYVDVSFISCNGSDYYGFQAKWDTNISDYLKLVELTPGTSVTPMENNADNGCILWSDATYSNPMVVNAGGAIWTATYLVSKDTPAGEYVVSLNVEVLGDASYDTAELGVFTAIITVTAPTAPSKIDISNATVKLGSSLTYTGNEQTQTVASVIVDGNVLIENVDYKVTKNKATNAGLYDLIVEGMGKYTGSKTVQFIVSKADPGISGSDITLVAGSSVNLNDKFSAKTELTYSIDDGASIWGNVLYAGNVAGTYQLTVSSKETRNFKADEKVYKVVIEETSENEDFIPSIPKTYELFFETNGGSKISTVRAIENTVVKLDSYKPTKDGYKFVGWFNDKDLKNQVSSVVMTKDMTVYAKWEEIIKEEEIIQEEEKFCDGGKDCPSYKFIDVDQNLWYHRGIDFVIKNGLMIGVSEDKFDPHGITTRAMIVTMLYRLEEKPEVNGKSTFTDVKDDAWYTDAIIWAEENDIVNGYGDGTFGPEDEITREQMVKILYNYAEYKEYDVTIRKSLNSFSDGDKVSDWAKKEMKWAIAADLINGMGDGTVAPQGKTERCQVATIFMRFCEKFVEEYAK